jgi:NitT/TauT family transport system substrate-binding protein
MRTSAGLWAPESRAAAPAKSNLSCNRSEPCPRFPGASIALTEAFGLAVPLTASLSAPASAKTHLKMVLNWKYEGPKGWFFLAQDRGYFKKAGLDMTRGRGNGSGAPIPLVASGTCDVGFGDMNALIQLAAQKPAEAPIAVGMLYNEPSFTIAVRSDSDIKTPKDLEGKTPGGPAGDIALKLFPALRKVAKVDCSNIKITNMQPNLRTATDAAFSDAAKPRHRRAANSER